jgi:hypothetical protein
MAPDVIEFRVKDGVLEYRTINLTVEEVTDLNGMSVKVLSYTNYHGEMYTNWYPVPTIEK